MTAMPRVFINHISKFLPNKPVSNDQIEGVLGIINGRASRAKAIVLRNNKIHTRYYALNEKGEATHNNTELTVGAIHQLMEETGLDGSAIELLSCGTSTPDQLLPSHASMVHGAWNNNNLEINSASGICTSGMNALKYGFMAIQSGSVKNAVCTGSERVSSWLKADKFNNESNRLEALEQNPMIGFEKDFLRWMLSDGAAALLLTNQPNTDSISLAIEWIEGISYANELETCMYAGAIKENGVLKPWSDMSPEEWLDQSVFAIKQDIKLLEANIIEKGVQSMDAILRKHQIAPDEINYFLPHISSFVFKDKLQQAFENKGIHIPAERWFINLDRVGNIGSASIYIQLEELFNSKNLKKGEKILLSVPESGRFNYVYALLEVC